MAKFKVIREHVGDRPYSEGEIRDADPDSVKYLVPHVLEPVAKPKAASKPAPAKAPAQKGKGK
jgi:hypothetical protein